ncbi:MAG TPA: cytochrome d ubiquinol oxidase subunit II [Thermodesulfobacteriota bacterium]|nr:cytochrome d ubiquinol oxidase subunit II [Thermodesulfobacteriota bacterium]
MDLVTIWSCLIGLAIILYVILDGFSLGVALLFRSTRNEEERNILMDSIAPVWDANQTWLVFGGGALLVAFPMIYGVLFTGLYIPLLTFIFGLIFRGVTFEFRANATRKGPWNMAFFLGSLVAVVAQGLTLGGILSGTKVVGNRFAGGPFDWLNPFSMTVAMALIAGYILLGSTYLIIKTTGPAQELAYRRAYQSAFFVLAFQILMTLWTPLHYPSTLSNWTSPPRVYFIWAFPLVGLSAFYEVIKNLRAHREVLPFAFSVVFFFAGYLGLIASIYPYVVPPNITFQDAAAQHETLRFTLWGVIIVLPLVLGYTAYSYAIFRGKVGKESHHY